MLIFLTALVWFVQLQAASVQQSGTIVGTVRSDDGSSVGGAVITLTGHGVALLTQSDLHGTFSFQDLPWGSYAVVARKMSYAAINDGPPALTSVSAGSPRGMIELELRRAASIVGRVIFSDGRPSVYAAVEAWCYKRGEELSLARTATTDDRGEFRLFGVASDRCFVDARTRWQGRDSAAVAAGRPPVKDLVVQYPTGERKTDKALPLHPGEIAAVGDLVVDLERQDPIRRQRSNVAVVSGQVVDISTTTGAFPAFVSAQELTRRTLQAAATDYGGHFSLDLKPGIYHVWASGTNYVSDRENALTIRIRSDGRNSEGGELTLHLRRAGTIEGRVIVDSGDPLQGAIVHLYRLRSVWGIKRLLLESRATSTDDQGVFRLFGLQPASYYVSASLGTGTGTTSALAGPVTQDEMTPPQFYPNGDATSAAAITVDAGSEVNGIVLTWPSIRSASRVVVHVVDPAGNAAPQARVDLSPTARSSLPLARGVRAETDISGSATFGGLAEGEYSVHASSGGNSFGTAVAQIVGDQPVTVWVKMGYGAEVHGRLVDSLTGLSLLNATSFSVQAFPTTIDDVPAIGSVPGSTPVASGEFVFRNMWGSALIRIIGPPGFHLKRVVSDGVDVTDTPIKFDALAKPHELAVEIGRDHTELTGTVTGLRGESLSACAVVAVAKDSSYLGPWSRFKAVIPCETDSSFHYDDLPQGQYLVFAVKSADDAHPDEPDWLNEHIGRARQIQLVDGATQNVALRLVQ